jgi:hypothetical protein
MLIALNISGGFFEEVFDHNFVDINFDVSIFPDCLLIIDILFQSIPIGHELTF